MEIPFPGLPFRAQQGFTRLPRRGRCLYKFKTKSSIFSFLIAELPPTEGSARRAKGVQFLKRSGG